MFSLPLYVARARWLVYLAIAALLLASLSCGVEATQAPSAPDEPSEAPAATEPPLTSEALLATATAAPTEANLPAPTQEAALAPPAAIPEQRLLVVEWPSKIRVGDSEIVRLSLEMDTEGNITPTAYVKGSQVSSQPVAVPNLYATHNVIAEATLDLAGVDYRPSGEVSEALLPGQPVTFVWSVRPSEIGHYRGTVWLHLRFIPRAGGEEIRMVLTAQLIEFEAVNFLGLGGAAARLMGGVGVVVGSVLGLDNLVPWFIKLVWPRKRLKKMNKPHA
jgi:hypothetical protein